MLPQNCFVSHDNIGSYKWDEWSVHFLCTVHHHHIQGVAKSGDSEGHSEQNLFYDFWKLTTLLVNERDSNSRSHLLSTYYIFHFYNTSCIIDTNTSIICMILTVNIEQFYSQYCSGFCNNSIFMLTQSWALRYIYNYTYRKLILCIIDVIGYLW